MFVHHVHVYFAAYIASGFKIIPCDGGAWSSRLKAGTEDTNVSSRGAGLTPCLEAASFFQ